MKARDDVVRGLVQQIRQRAVGPHPAGVRATVTVRQAFVIASDGQGQRDAAVAQGDDTGLTPLEALLDDDRTGPQCDLDGGEGFVEGIGHGHALAGGQAVRLDHDPATRSVQLAGERRGRTRLAERASASHRHTRRRRDLVAERLARLDPGGRRARPEDRDPGLRQGIGDTGHQRRLRTDEHEFRGHGSGHGHDRRSVEGIDPRDPAHPRQGGDGLASGGHDHLVHAGFRGQLPGERVFATASAHDEDPGRHDQPSATAHVGIPGRLRIGRQARSIVWVRSGPTDTSTIGTLAWRSMAVT